MFIIVLILLICQFESTMYSMQTRQQAASTKPDVSIKQYEAILKSEFEKLHVKSNPVQIKNLLEVYSTEFPVDTFCWNDNGDKALHIAIRKGCSSLASFLVRDMHATNVPNNQQKTPFQIAVEISEQNPALYTKIRKLFLSKELIQ